jgi:hypothetical protein
LALSDNRGNTVLFSLTSGSPFLAFNDSNQNTRISLSVPTTGESSAALNLYGGDGNGRISLVVSEDGVPLVGLSDDTDTLQFFFGVSSSGSPFLTLADGDANERIKLVVAPDGTAGLVMSDGQGDGRLGVLLGSDGSPSIGLFDVDTDGVPAIAVFDADGTVLFGAL